MSDENFPLQYALSYGRRGWLVFPCWWPIGGGACACGNSACAAVGKHPVGALVPAGHLDASRDLAQLREWWARMPQANVAVRTGSESGLVVVDVDPRHGGTETLEEYERLRPEGALPQTLTADTGGSGQHLFFRHPGDGPVRGRKPWLRPGVDVKADGGYVVAAPSRHESGRRYLWREPIAELAELPWDVLTGLRVGPGLSGDDSLPPLPALDDVLRGVPEGERNDTLFRWACRLRRQLGDGSEARVAITTTILEAARRSGLEEGEARALLESAFRQDHSDPDFPLEWLRSLPILRENPTEPAERVENKTDEGNARRFLRRHARVVKWSQQLGWMVWDGARWKRDEQDLHHQLARATTQSIYEELELLEGEQRRLLQAWARQSESSGRLRALLDVAHSDPLIARTAEAFDRDPWLVNCPNGVLDLRTQELKPHDRDQLHTRLAGAPYEPGAQCPRWLDFLAEVLPDEDLREFVRRAAGYALTGVIREELLLVLHGRGANGKTVFIEVLRAVLGSYATSTDVETFTQRTSGGIPNDVAALRGARLITMQESQEGVRLAAGLLKRFTGGDEVRARFMRQEFFNFRPTGKLWLSTNYVPRADSADQAIWRRIRLVPFDVVIPIERRIPRDRLEAELLAEAPGILWWAVNGCAAWQERGLAEPAAVVLATESERREQDWFADFFEEVAVRDTEAFSTTEALHDAYRAWALWRGDRVIWSATKLVRELKKRGVEDGREPQTMRRGLRGLRLLAGQYRAPTL